MLNIIAGRAGSGKSGKCIAEFNRYIQKNRQADSCAYFFVPEQYTMLTERRLLLFQRRENDAVKGLLGHEVLNFKRFSYRILSLYGGAAAESLDSCGKIMLLTSVLDRLQEENWLQYFHAILGKPHEIARLLSLLEEFGKYGVTSEVLDALTIEDATLQRKISDLAAVLKAYKARKLGKFIDEEDVFEKMLVQIKERRFFQNRRVWIDSFTGFTSKELELIALMLRQCEQVTVTLCTDLRGEPAFACTDHTYRVLTDLADKAGVPCNTVNLSADLGSNRFKYNNPGLFALEQNLPRARSIERETHARHIRIAECAGQYEEVVRCAEQIQKLHTEDKIAYEHIAVALRDVSGYDVMIKAIFRKYGIPFYIDDKKTLDNNPLIKTMLSLLNIIADDWQVRDVLECFKSGILSFGADRDQMENDILRRRLRGRRRWSKEQQEDCALFFSEIDALAGSLANCKTMKECCVAFCLFLNKWELKRTVEDLAEKLSQSNDPELSDEYFRIWNIAMEVLEQVVLFLGGLPVTGAADAAGQMRRLLNVGFSQYKIGFLPSAIESVQIMNIERSRSGEIKALFLLGANDGVLPAHFTDDGILRDSERELMKRQHVALADDSEAKASKENYYLYFILSLPSDRLEISYPLEDLSGNGRKLSPVVLRKLQSTFPGLKITHEMPKTAKEGPSVPSALVQIPQGINGSLLRIGDTFRTTVSRIESYYNCPFSYFLTYGLRLRPREEAELQMYDLGTVMHNLIDEASESLFEMPGDFDAAQCRELIDSVYERVASKMRFVNTELTKREEYALKRIRNYAGIAFYNLKRQIDSGKFVPCGFEVPFDFSQDSLLKPVTLTPPEENAPFQKLHVVGRIDRYDTLDQDGIKYVRVVDYKSAPVSLSERELSAGTKLQLITYLNAVIDSYPKGTAAPGGVLYFQFNDDIASAKDHISCVESIERGKQFVMNGFVLDRKEVVDGMTGGRDTGVIGGRLLQKGGISFSSNKLLKSAEEFESMRQEAYGNILRAGEKIAKGSYSIAPSPVPEISPCQYCNLRSICASCADV